MPIYCTLKLKPKLLTIVIFRALCVGGVLRKPKFLLYNLEQKSLDLLNSGEGKVTQTPGFSTPNGPNPPFDQITHTT